MLNFGEISSNEFKKISYLDCSVLGKRVFPLQPCYNENGQWEMWISGPNGLENIQAKPVEADYFAKKKERETDIYLQFINTMIKHAYWPDLIYYIDGIRHDIHNLGASVAKLNLFFGISRKNTPVIPFVATELEYIFAVCRSIFDLLQEVISRLWIKVELNDCGIHKNNLPKSFNKMVSRENTVLSREEIQNHFHLPYNLSSFYFNHAPFFIKLRDYRDKILHSGKGFDLIFETERGFAVPVDMEPFSFFGDIWKKEDTLHPNLVSLRTLAAHIIIETLNTCDGFTDALVRDVKLPPDIAPGYQIFIRGYHTDQLCNLHNCFDKEPWWN